MLKYLLAASAALVFTASAAPPATPVPACCSKPPNRLGLLTGAVPSATTAPASQPATASDRPNFVFILCDDLRWNALGCMGNPVVQTPNIDRLAAQGTLFHSHFATTSICCVSRASIFSGQYERRHGIGDFKTPFTAGAWAETYPALLRQSGYRTGFVGKFGVGDAPAIAAMAKEFDYWKGLPGQGGEWFIQPGDPERKHTTSRFGDQALEFLGGCDAAHPFCLSLSFNSPHARDNKPREFQPDDRDESLYSSEPIAPPATAAEEFFQRLPDFVQKSEGHRRWERRFATPEMALNTTRDYFRLVSGVDREVGRIVETLQKAGLSEHTVIVFTSDNGFFLGDRGLSDKFFLYEESVRLPLVIMDPRIPAANRIHSVDAMTLNIDFAPSLLDWAGLPAPKRMQGTSIRSLLTAQPPADWRTEFFYEHHYGPKIIPPSEGVRTTQWSFIHWLPPNPEVEELYDVRDDPMEAKNRIADPALAPTLQELRAKWQKYAVDLK